jgi:hypothetical protein
LANDFVGLPKNKQAQKIVSSKKCFILVVVVLAVKLFFNCESSIFCLSDYSNGKTMQLVLALNKVKGNFH